MTPFRIDERAVCLDRGPLHHPQHRIHLLSNTTHQNVTYQTPLLTPHKTKKIRQTRKETTIENNSCLGRQYSSATAATNERDRRGYLS